MRNLMELPIGELGMAFGTQGSAHYLFPKPFQVYRTKLERVFVHKMRTDPEFRTKIVMRSVLRRTTTVSKDKKAEVSLVPIGWGK